MKKFFSWTFVSLSSVLFASEVLAATNLAETVAMQQQKIAAPEHQAKYEQHYKKSNSPKVVEDKITHKQSKKTITGNASGTSRAVTRVIIQGNNSISTCKLKSAIAPYLTGGVSSDETPQIKNAVENYYKKQGYLLPVANVQISGDTVSVQVIEGSIEDAVIVFDGKTKMRNELNNSYLLKLIEKLETIPAIRTHQLEHYLLLINKIHGYKAEYELMPLAQPRGHEVASIVIKISKERGKAGISVDNDGLKEIGKYEFMANVQGYNVISNDSLMINAGTSDKYKQFKMLSGGYLKRITPYGTSLSVMGTYFTDDPYNTAGSTNSKSTYVYGRLDQYLLLNNDYSVKLEVKAEQRDITYYAEKEKARDYKYTLGVIGGKIKIVDFLDTENWIYPYYNWALKDVHYGASSMYPINFDKNFNYFVVDWYRTQFIGENFSFMLSASYQGTNKKLPSEHLYSINGPHTIKGYTSGIVSADQGVTGNLELRYNHGLKGRMSKFVETAQLFGFYGLTHFIDHNKDDSRNKHPNNIYFDKSTLQAAGGGIRLFFPYKFYGEFYAAQPLNKHVMIDGIRTTNKTQYRFVISKDFAW